MIKLFCDKCQAPIKGNEIIAQVTIEESEYIGNNEFLKTRAHDSYGLHLCCECRYELLQFLNIYNEEEEEKLPWE